MFIHNSHLIQSKAPEQLLNRLCGDCFADYYHQVLILEMPDIIIFLLSLADNSVDVGSHCL